MPKITKSKTSTQSLAGSLKSIKVDNAAHLVVKARAGTGKTTTLVEGLKVVKGMATKLTPSEQQAAVWLAMAEGSECVNTIGFCAFNKSIADELKSRVPAGCDAMTLHSLGNRAVRSAFGFLKLENYRVQNFISELLEADIRDLRRTKMVLISAVEKLVGLCKQTLVGVEDGCFDDSLVDDTSLERLAAHYDIDLNGSRDQAFELTRQIMAKCADVAADKSMDFNDMIWLPVALNLPVPQYDLLLVDEAQDLNRCQQELARKAGRRLILCGDDKQAIYGFAGADSDSIPRMVELLGDTPRGCKVLPLTVTRRCGKAIVAEAQTLVPDFEAFETNGEGKISYATLPTRSSKAEDDYRGRVADGDMILCRVNAPLVSQCFRFLKAGRKATIQGRDIGAGLISTIKKLKANSLPELVGKLDDWLYKEEAKENAKRNPSEAKLIALADRHDCLSCFCEDATSVDDVINRIERIFTDDRSGTGIRLSSVHKAKGLEAKRVFILLPKGSGMPHPMARTKWQRKQEDNIFYVAITRAIEELVYVSEAE